VPRFDVKRRPPTFRYKALCEKTLGTQGLSVLQTAKRTQQIAAYRSMVDSAKSQRPERLCIWRKSEDIRQVIASEYSQLLMPNCPRPHAPLHISDIGVRNGPLLYDSGETSCSSNTTYIWTPSTRRCPERLIVNNRHPLTPNFRIFLNE
jgi:hypothetical protein